MEVERDMDLMDIQQQEHQILVEVEVEVMVKTVVLLMDQVVRVLLF